MNDDSNIGSDGFLAPPYDMIELAASEETYLNPDVSNSEAGDIVWYTFEFEEPYIASAGQVLGASFEYFGGASLTIAESSANFDGTAAIYGPSAADGSYAWRGTEEMPMVRLNLDPNIEPTEGELAIYGCTNPAACNYDVEATIDDGSCTGVFDADLPWLGLELVQEHTDGPLEGMSTYRLYVNTPNVDDRLVACFGDNETPLILESTSSPAWFQHPVPETAFATDIDPAMYAGNPELQFDSWLTIGAEDNTAAIDLIVLDDPTFEAFTAFEVGESIEVSGDIGSAWFALPIESNVEMVAGEDKKVLIARLTTAGEISGQIQVQIFLNDDNTNEFKELLPINVVGPLEGCRFLGLQL